MGIFGMRPHTTLECVCFGIPISNFKNVFAFSIVELVYREGLSIHSKFSRWQEFNMSYGRISSKQVKNYNLKGHCLFVINQRQNIYAVKICKALVSYNLLYLLQIFYLSIANCLSQKREHRAVLVS